MERQNEIRKVLSAGCNYYGIIGRVRDGHRGEIHKLVPATGVDASASDADIRKARSVDRRHCCNILR